ncbi:hypothetical protein [Psychromonas ossibalaenae]|uniref:hypothetical protein n=1 Tax=Psychromonas ossibalaenae TaxID=444922 RepID=UPI00036ECA51|nr:hypothetical protein [Psychromonas ossibalaenae]
MKIKIWPLGFKAQFNEGTKHVDRIVTGTTCGEMLTGEDIYAEKMLGSTEPLFIRYQMAGNNLELILGVEVVDATHMTPGVYGISGYAFNKSVFTVSPHSVHLGTDVPIINSLALMIPHVFYIDFPYDAVVLNPSQSQPDQIMSGELPFYATSNERYSISLQCGAYGGSSADNCYFDADANWNCPAACFFHSRMSPWI